MTTEHWHVILRRPRGGFFRLSRTFLTFEQARDARVAAQVRANLRGDREAYGVASCARDCKEQPCPAPI